MYLVTGRKLLSQEGVKKFSVSLDGTRMGQRDMLYAALYSADLGKALWCPPQDRRDENAETSKPKQAPRTCIALVVFAACCRFLTVRVCQNYMLGHFKLGKRWEPVAGEAVGKRWEPTSSCGML